MGEQITLEVTATASAVVIHADGTIAEKEEH